MSKIIILIALIGISLSSCSSSERDIKESKTDSTSISDLNRLAVQKFNNEYIIEYNSVNDYALCVQQNKTKIPGPVTVKYFIYDLSKNIISYEGSIPNGNIEWRSNYQLIINEIPGIIMKDGPNINAYILNVKNNSKTKLNGEIN